MKSLQITEQKVYKLPNTIEMIVKKWYINHGDWFMKYISRLADEIIKRKLKGKAAVLIEGPKWCGKTTTAEQLSNSVLYMSNPSEKEQNINLVEISPSILLEGEVPRLIDEWQIAPKIWDAVRFEADHRAKEGQFILTGSSVPANMQDVTHSGTGRFAFYTMRPMSLFESGESNGSISLSELFNGNQNLSGSNNLSLDDIAFLCCRGGWPRSVFLDKDIALDGPYDYLEAVVNKDISNVDGVMRNSERTRKLLKSYARNIGTQASNETLKNDIISNDIASLDTDTIVSYVNALKKIFVIEDMPAWNPNLRSKSAIRNSDTRYFVDPSLAIASLGIGPNDLKNDLKTFGLIFEDLAVRDLRVYAESINGTVYHYRDSSDLECDAVVHLRNGNYGLIEIKIGGETLINEGIKNLIKLSSKIDTDKMNKPSFMMVLTATGSYAYKNEDGIYIIPIGCLKN